MTPSKPEWAPPAGEVVYSGPSDGGFDLGEIVSNVAGNLIPSAVTYLSGQQAQEGNAGAASSYATATQAAAEALKSGYGQQLGIYNAGFDETENLINRGFNDTTRALDQGYDNFAEGARDAYTNYSDIIYPQFNRYGDQMQFGDEMFRDELWTGANDSADFLGQGADAFASYYEPYMESGDSALSYLTSILQIDPSTLDPAQQRLLETAKRDMVGRLAASGLMGSGRAGVATVNEGVNDLLAKMFVANRNRQDQVAMGLNNQGYGASGQVAGSERELGTNLANLNYQTANTTANNTQRVAQDVAKTGFDLSKDVAGKAYATEGQIAQNALTQGRDVANLTGQRYGQLKDLTAGRTNAAADTTMGTANIDATTIGSTRNMNYATDVANSQIQGEALGKIANVLTTDNKKKAAAGTNPGFVS